MPQPPQSVILMNGLPALGPASGPNLVVGPFSGVSQLGGGARRNRIVNGDMRIDQANAGALVSVNANATFRSVDKIKAVGTNAAGVFSIQQQAGGPNGFTNFIRATVTTLDAAPAAGALYLFQQAIEGTYCQDLQFGVAANGQFVTVSFWVRSSLAGAFSASVSNGAGSRSYAFNFILPAANVWTPISVVIPVDVAGAWVINAGIGLSLNFDLGCGATFRGTAGTWQAANLIGVTGAARLISTNAATFDLTGLQLEPGAGATTFEQHPLGDELRLCQREFCSSFPLGTAPAQNAGTTGVLAYFAQIAAVTTGYSLPVYFPVQMRAAPAITTYNPAAANNKWRNNAGTDSGVPAINFTSATATNVGNPQVAGDLAGATIYIHWSADTRL